MLLVASWSPALPRPTGQTGALRFLCRLVRPVPGDDAHGRLACSGGLLRRADQRRPEQPLAAKYRRQRHPMFRAGRRRAGNRSRRWPDQLRPAGSHVFDAGPPTAGQIEPHRRRPGAPHPPGADKRSATGPPSCEFSARTTPHPLDRQRHAGELEGPAADSYGPARYPGREEDSGVVLRRARPTRPGCCRSMPRGTSRSWSRSAPPEGVEPAELELGDQAIQRKAIGWNRAAMGPTANWPATAGCSSAIGARRGPGGPDDWMVISGHARGGDSGGPCSTSRGRMVGVLWGTDGKEVVCVQAGPAARPAGCGREANGRIPARGR